MALCQVLFIELSKHLLSGLEGGVSLSGQEEPPYSKLSFLKEIPSMYIPGLLKGGAGLPKLSLNWKLGSFECKCGYDLSFYKLRKRKY